MLSEKELDKISRSLTDGNRGHAEKLYLQDIILSTISRETVDELVFKGGTALLKFYQLDRFSEDLDFTLTGEIDFEELLEKIERDLEAYNAEVEEIDFEERDNSINARLAIRGPLYNGDRRSLCFIRIEVNKESDVIHKNSKRYTPRFQDLTAFDLPVLSEEEILAEKIRAIRTREKPRDLYDIYHLVEKGTRVDLELVNSKLEYYDLEHDLGKTVSKAERLEKNWDSPEVLTYSRPPEFEEAVKALEKSLEQG